MVHKAGFVNIIGNPNVGKSTLMNELVGENLSVVTNKAQTTRHRIRGIVNGKDYQVVFSDTPGIIRPAYKLHEAMMKMVQTAFTDADIILYVTDNAEKSDKNAAYLEKLRKIHKPVIVAINKVDLAAPGETELLVAEWKKILPEADVITISALYKSNIPELFSRILNYLPESPKYYPDDDLTDKTERFFVSEIIRGEIFRIYRREVPYSCEVSVQSYKDEKEILKIEAVINVIRESQKGIIIGHKGEAIKKLGIAARIKIEEFAGKKVFLGLSVKVAPDWRDSEKYLKSFGY
jgi:GTPase